MTSGESVQEESIKMPLMDSAKEGLCEPCVAVLQEAGVVNHQLGILTLLRPPATVGAKRSTELSTVPLLSVRGEKNIQ